MPSTYTTNLGIEKIATGEQSGTWGTTTNTNFDLVDQAINGVQQVTLAAAGTSGSPNDLPITDGTASDGRNKFIEFIDGGDLGATAYVQLTPNDAEKIVFFRNSLSASRSVIVFQGTYNASNDFEIPNGKDVVLKFDGAGASATVTQMFVDLKIDALDATTVASTNVNATTVDSTNVEVTNIKAKDGTASATIADSTGVMTIASAVLTTADINGGTADNVTIGGGTAAAGTFTTLNATGGGSLTGTWSNLGTVTTVDINGGTIDGVTIGGASAGAGTFTTLTTGSTVTLNGGTANGVLYLNGSKVATSGSALTFNGTNLTVTGFINNSTSATGNPSAFGATSNGDKFIAINSGAWKAAIGVNGAANMWQQSTDAFLWYLNTSEKMRLTSTGLGIGTTSPTAKLTLGNNTETGEIATSFYNSSATGFVGLEGSSGNRFVGSSTNNMFIGTATSDGLELATNNNVRMVITSAGNVGIGTTSPGQLLSLTRTGGETQFSMTSDTNQTCAIYLGDTDAVNRGVIQYDNNGDYLRLFTSATEAMRITSTGNVGIGTTSPSAPLHVVADTNALSLRISGRSADDRSDIEFYENDNITKLTSLANEQAYSLWSYGSRSLYTDANIHIFRDGTATERLRLDSSGNLGLGVTPSTWNVYKAMQINAGGGVMGTSTGTSIIGNYYYNSGYKYTTTAAATLFDTSNGAFTWYTAPSGTAGNAITFTQAMTLDASGKLGIGTTSPASNITVEESALVTDLRLINTGSASANKYTTLFQGSSSTGLSDWNESGVLEATSSGGLYLGAYAGPIRFYVDNVGRTERMRIDTSGNVGIGTSSPNAKLDVQGILAISNGATNYWGLDRNNSDGSFTIADGTTERMRIDSSGNVGIGDTSPSYRLSVLGSSDGTIASFGNAQDNAYLLLQAADNFGSNNSVDSKWSIRWRGRPNAGGHSLAFYDEENSVERMRIDSSGHTLPGADNTQDLGSSTKRWNDLFLGGGVYVGGTTSANLLDDYEEGTWTPVPTSTGATFTTSKSGEYTKIGRLVYFKCFLDNSSAPTGTLTNEMTIAGLPFTSESGGYGASVSIGYLVSVDYPAGALELVARVSASSTSITLGWTQDDSTLADFFASAFDATDARIAITGCYQAA